MSSATSTDRPAPPWRGWHFFVIGAFLSATVAVLVARETTPQNLVLVSVAVLTAGGAGLGLHRMLAPLVPGSSFEFVPTRSARARLALEREKQLVLRSIKELEFDRAMGKVAEADFADMVARLRARAIGLMKQLDEKHSGYRTLIEREVQERLGIGSAAAPGGAAVKPSAARVMCGECHTANEHDAKFCKACGSRLGVIAHA
jgi:hypothetical protein